MQKTRNCTPDMSVGCHWWIHNLFITRHGDMALQYGNGSAVMLFLLFPAYGSNKYLEIFSKVSPVSDVTFWRVTGLGPAPANVKEKVFYIYAHYHEFILKFLYTGKIKLNSWAVTPCINVYVPSDSNHSPLFPEKVICSAITQTYRLSSFTI